MYDARAKASTFSIESPRQPIDNGDQRLVESANQQGRYVEANELACRGVELGKVHDRKAATVFAIPSPLRRAAVVRAR